MASNATKGNLIAFGLGVALMVALNWAMLPPAPDANTLVPRYTEVRFALSLFSSKLQLLEVNDDIKARLVRSTERLVAKASNNGANPTYPPIRVLPADQRKRILVTGGAGFVGSHLVDVLMMQGHLVTVVDNFFTGRRENVQHWMGHPNFELVRHDIIEPYMMELDQIYHLACPASPPHYMYNPIKTIKTSVMGTLNMLGLAQRVKARLLFTSTSEVYGDPLEHPQKETYWGHVNPIGPRACYDEGKRVAETMCYSYEKQNGVEVRVARIFNTYGPRMNLNDGRVVSNFIRQALKGEDLTIYGDGSQTRSFQYVSDLVNGLVKLMNSNFSKPVNIGNPTESRIVEFARHIKKRIPTTSQIKFLPATEDDPQQRKPDISRAQTVLGWRPLVLLDDGLDKTIEYFRQELGLAPDQPKKDVWII